VSPTSGLLEPSEAPRIIVPEAREDLLRSIQAASCDGPHETSPCATTPQTTGWLANQLYKAYLSSFNMCLSQLGWVPQSILEIGSGDGSMVSYTGKLFMDADLHGVDCCANKVALAREHNCCKLQFTHVDSAESLPFDAGQFDLVISHGFLGRTQTPRHWVSEMARVSAEAVILSTPHPKMSQWLKWLPGGRSAQLAGTPIVDSASAEVSLIELKSWLKRQNLTPELILHPVPHQMILARK